MPTRRSDAKPLTAPRWVKLTEAAGLYPISVNTLRRRIADGTLLARRMPRSRIVVIDQDELEALFVAIPSAHNRPGR